MITYRAFKETLLESAHVYCPSCGEDYGKASEYGSTKLRACANCGYGHDTKSHGNASSNDEKAKGDEKAPRGLLAAHKRRIAEVKKGAGQYNWQTAKEQDMLLPKTLKVSKPVLKDGALHTKVSWEENHPTWGHSGIVQHVTSKLDKDKNKIVHPYTAPHTTFLKGNEKWSRDGWDKK